MKEGRKELCSSEEKYSLILTCTQSRVNHNKPQGQGVGRTASSVSGPSHSEPMSSRWPGSRFVKVLFQLVNCTQYKTTTSVSVFIGDKNQTHSSLLFFTLFLFFPCLPSLSAFLSEVESLRVQTVGLQSLSAELPPPYRHPHQSWQEASPWPPLLLLEPVWFLRPGFHSVCFSCCFARGRLLPLVRLPFQSFLGDKKLLFLLVSRLFKSLIWRVRGSSSVLASSSSSFLSILQTISLLLADVVLGVARLFIWPVNKSQS